MDADVVKWRKVERMAFMKWFKSLLTGQKTCFLRDVLRDNMLEMRASWMKAAAKCDGVQLEHNEAPVVLTPELYQELTELEYGHPDFEYRICAYCCVEKGEEHRPGCTMGNFIKKIEGHYERTT